MKGERLRRTRALVRRSAWPGWIWAVPIAAFGVVGWLGVQALLHGGETVTIVLDQAYGIKADETDVTLRGVKIGEVSKVALDADGKHVDVEAKIDRTRKDDLRSGTRFYVLGAKADLSNPASLKALISGPEIVMEPGLGAPTRHFTGADRRPALAPQHPPTVNYVVRFTGAVGGLKTGADVELRGFRVGTVTSVRLRYDAASGTLSTPVEIALEPGQLGIAGVAPPADGNWRPSVDAMLRHLIGDGLRARLAQDPPLVGSSKVKLDFVHGAPQATLAEENGVLVIPGVESADIDDMTAKADQIITRIDQLPIKETGDKVRDTVARIDALVASPRIDDSLKHIDRSLAQIDRTLADVSPQIAPLVAQLRATANAADDAAAAASRTLNGDATSQNNLQDVLRELTDAARSIRVLADYLDRHPEALIRGRQGASQ
ncbi:mammalian cell entry protein [Caballeronia hypogeia]|uniref:Mammalian cell entry protein n=1 Tax=Caballeronia hypogeia TaxID=1777140 RepID=A0A158CGS6_9BURK|nr:MlaD family protein [Caballeronia hypogeia]SAK80717.1 mammalian cell entry protein [Caballeronia hypogeia]